MDGGDEIGVGDRLALRVRDRDQLHFRKGRESRLEIGQIEPAVQGRQALAGEMAEDREMQEIDMEMEDVELVGGAAAPDRASQAGSRHDR